MRKLHKRDVKAMSYSKNLSSIIFTAAVMAFALSGCGGQQNAESKAETQEQSETEPVIKAEWDDPAEQSAIVFTADGDIADFKTLELTFDNADDSGTMFFKTKDVENYGELKDGEAVTVGMEMLGDTPNNGIAYTYGDNTTKYYSVDISGNDGSVLLAEFAPLAEN